VAGSARARFAAVAGLVESSAKTRARQKNRSVKKQLSKGRERLSSATKSFGGLLYQRASVRQKASLTAVNPGRD
jgi:hypothetical protein